MQLKTFFIFALMYLVVAVSAALQYKGADISSLLHLEAAGKQYSSDSGVVTPLEILLKHNGANSVRQRILVNPANGNYNLDYNLRLARRVTAAGMSVYVDMYLSDTWADPAHQTTPAAWKNYNIDNLTWALYNYTLMVGNIFASNNIPIELVSIGNEIRAGFLWPLGSTSNYCNIARLLHSASAGIKDSKLNPKPKIMIHLDNGWDWNAQKYFYDTVLAQGPLLSSDFDVIGISFHPFYSTRATLAALESSLEQLGSRYGKGVLVVETDWPATSCSGTTFPSDLKGIPQTAAGQTTFIKQVAAIVDAVPAGLGLYYWEPAWIWNTQLGSPCADNLMVDGNGKVRESFKVWGQI